MSESDDNMRRDVPPGVYDFHHGNETFRIIVGKDGTCSLYEGHDSVWTCRATRVTSSYYPFELPAELRQLLFLADELSPDFKIGPTLEELRAVHEADGRELGLL